MTNLLCFTSLNYNKEYMYKEFLFLPLLTEYSLTSIILNKS